MCTADRPDLADFLRACLRGGVDVVQLREKHLEARPLLARARLAAE
ncbi:MAG: thiamine phosphate synthase, partial [Actinomycetota bacterium]|nr:thiamine phosphate synthase [Actinomycetota bacterium]